MSAEVMSAQSRGTIGPPKIRVVEPYIAFVLRPRPVDVIPRIDHLKLAPQFRCLADRDQREYPPRFRLSTRGAEIAHGVNEQRGHFCGCHAASKPPSPSVTSMYSETM